MNEGVKNAARRMRVPLWAVADRVGVSESTMTRMMRRELSEEEQSKLIRAISEIARERVSEC